jgi:hypothetical protein
VVRSEKQFIDDLGASLAESPQHVMEFFHDEVLAQIRAHLQQILFVTAALIVAEETVALLAAFPEPLLTKVIAAILQIGIIVFVGVMAAEELKGAFDEGRRWLATAGRANGQAALISEASRAFVHMVWHIVMAVLALAGIRARFGGVAAPAAGGATAGEMGAAGGATQSSAAAGADVIPITRPRVKPRPAPPPPTQPTVSAVGRGGALPKLKPFEAPQVEPLAPPVPDLPPPTPAPVTSAAASTTPSAGPGVQPVPALAAGLSSSTQDPQVRVRLHLPLEKKQHAHLYQRLVRGHDLEHTPGLPRKTAQARNWDRELRPNGRMEMNLRAWVDLERIGISEARRLRPDWTWRSREVDMEVDHRVEWQVLGPAARANFGDSMPNHELLDEPSNNQAGKTLRQNIRLERKRLADATKNPTWISKRIFFDEVIVPNGAPLGDRWLPEQIQAGEHYQAYLTHERRRLPHP